MPLLQILSQNHLNASNVTSNRFIRAGHSNWFDVWFLGLGMVIKDEYDEHNYGVGRDHDENG